jgi:tetratricopeptide (TPR) repeat protein
MKLLPPMHNVGQAMYHLAEVDMASNHFSQCLKHDPEHASCKMWFKKCRAVSKKVAAGDNALNAGMYTEAVTAWQEAVALDPQHTLHSVPLHVKIAQALELLQQWSDSIVAAEAALRLDADNKVSLAACYICTHFKLHSYSCSSVCWLQGADRCTLSPCCVNIMQYRMLYWP